MPPPEGYVLPRVSVVIPLYNTERYIEETLRSVLAQTFTDFEVLVIDDGSRDSGPRLAASTGDPRVRVIAQLNRGLAGARNSGIRYAVGEFVALLDADDAWHPDKLARHVAAFDADPELGLSFSASQLVDDDGRDLAMVQSPRSEAVTVGEIFCRNPVGNGSAPVIRATALAKVAFDDAALGRRCWFDESFRQSEDIECWMRLAVIAKCKFAGIAEPLTRYRVNSAGLSANVDAQLATWRRFRAKVKAYAPEIEAEFGGRAEGYQLRYLARRAIRSHDGRTAFRLAWQAVRFSPAILRDEPVRTSTTLFAAAALGLLPDAVFDRLWRGAVRVASHVPGLRV